jgi:2-polyprenyl-6-methoxyphenol hydroxylase-like FAD-dependent oxidoreductase
MAATARKIEQGRKLEHLSAEQLKALVLRLIERSHPDFHDMVRLSDPGSLSVLPIRTSLPVDAWETTRATLIGDAIHSMTPYRGIGANVALRDAALLCANLAAAARGERTIEEAVHDYEAKMRDYGFAAVRSSLAAMRQAVADQGLGFRFRKLALRAVNASPWLKHRFLASMGND